VSLAQSKTVDSPDGSRASTNDGAGIIKNSIFESNAGVQLMAFTVAISVSATWLMIATKKGWPVSTTYSLISSLIGVGVATGGSPAVNWVSHIQSALFSSLISSFRAGTTPRVWLPSGPV
jgi:phosphate/sulfate permease